MKFIFLKKNQLHEDMQLLNTCRVGFKPNLRHPTYSPYTRKKERKNI